MAVVLVEGFDTYNSVGTGIGVQANWIITGNSYWLQSMLGGRYGGQSFHHYGSNPYSGGFSMYRVINTPISQGTYGFAFNYTPICNGTWIFTAASAFSPVITLAVNTDRSISAFYGGSSIGTSIPYTVNPGIWNYIEVEFVLNSGSGIVNVWVNGNEVISLSGLNTGSGTINAVGIIGSIASAGTDFFVDDIYLTNTPTRLGERRVETLYPNADGGTLQWVPSTGTTHYNLVNSPQVDTSTYISSDTVGNLDQLHLSSLSSIPTAIDAVNVVMYAQKTDATTRAIELSVDSAGTITDGPSQYIGTTFGQYSRLLDVDPHTSAAWSPSAVDNLILQPKVSV